MFTRARIKFARALGLEVTITPPPESNRELREDGSFARREDGGFSLREFFVTTERFRELREDGGLSLREDSGTALREG